MMTTIALAGTYTMSHNYNFIFVVRTLNICALSNFQVCSIVLLSMITMPYISPPRAYSS